MYSLLLLLLLLSKVEPTFSASHSHLVWAGGEEKLLQAADLLDVCAVVPAWVEAVVAARGMGHVDVKEYYVGSDEVCLGLCPYSCPYSPSNTRLTPPQAARTPIRPVKPVPSGPVPVPVFEKLPDAELQTFVTPSRVPEADKRRRSERIPENTWRASQDEMEAEAEAELARGGSTLNRCVNGSLCQWVISTSSHTHILLPLTYP